MFLADNSGRIARVNEGYQHSLPRLSVASIDDFLGQRVEGNPPQPQPPGRLFGADAKGLLPGISTPVGRAGEIHATRNHYRNTYDTPQTASYSRPMPHA